jgi:hypothetical protein
MKRNIMLMVLLMVMFNTDTLLAQLYQDAAGISTTIRSSSELRKNTHADSLQNRSFRFRSVDIWAPLPITKIGRNDFFATVNFHQSEITYANQQAIDATRPERIYDIKTFMMMRVPLNKSLGLLLIAMPTLSSDFRERFSTDDFIMQGAVVLNKKIKSASDLELGVGIFTTYIFGEAILLPAITFDYKSANGKWLAQGYWPRFTFLRNINQNNQLGLAISIDGSRYNIQNFISDDNEQVEMAEFSIIHTGLQYNRKIFKNIWSQLQTGIAFNNQYNLVDRDLNTIKNGDYSLENMAYSKLMITYRF